MSSSDQKMLLKNILIVLLIGIIVGIGIGVLFTPDEYVEYENDVIVNTEINHFKYIIKILKISFAFSFIITITYLIYKFFRKN